MELELHNKDCMGIMAEYPDNYFDLAIVDPPYGIDAANMTMGRGSASDTGKLKRKDWDKSAPPPKYFNELRRISNEQIIWGANHFMDSIHFSKNSSCWVMWDKNDYNSDFADGELAWTSFESVTKIFKRARALGGDSRNKIHPTQKPIELYKWLYSNYAKPNMKILDTHLGSGSNAIAAYEMDMGEFVGCELDPDYFAAAKKRIDEALSQQKLFQ